jgi:hypothetical protein
MPPHRSAPSKAAVCQRRSDVRQSALCRSRAKAASAHVHYSPQPSRRGDDNASLPCACGFARPLGAASVLWSALLLPWRPRKHSPAAHAAVPCAGMCDPKQSLLNKGPFWSVRQFCCGSHCMFVLRTHLRTQKRMLCRFPAAAACTTSPVPRLPGAHVQPLFFAPEASHLGPEQPCPITTPCISHCGAVAKVRFWEGLARKLCVRATHSCSDASFLPLLKLAGPRLLMILGTIFISCRGMPRTASSICSVDFRTLF